MSNQAGIPGTRQSSAGATYGIMRCNNSRPCTDSVILRMIYFPL
jgi:hypothetical protein